MLRRLHPVQPESFAFTPANQAWAEAQITKYPEGRQASAIIPLLWRAQEQEGWLSRPAIEHVAALLDMAYIRALEVATFYFMFQLQPVGSVAHFQICGTTSCMLCGSEDLMAICKERIAERPHDLSPDGKFSWEEVECLGACSNAPMAQIGKDYYEDLTPARLLEMIDEMDAGSVPVPGPQNGRFAAEPLSGLTSLPDFESGHTKYNASVQLAVDIGDTLKRIDGTEVPLTTPWRDAAQADQAPPAVRDDLLQKGGLPGTGTPAGTSAAKARDAGPSREQAREQSIARPAEGGPARAAEAEGAADPALGRRPAGLEAPRGTGPDDLRRISGIGPKLEAMLHGMGCYHYDQIAGWSDEEIAWMDANLKGFRGRVSRDDWITQARELNSSLGANKNEDEGTS
ncbi:NADH-quinone oxidoreductase subunit E [Brevirhabdus pacifica]|uniref:NADH-quinone oxidoreductase subunit E n=2 Tax=Brevirhabdus pacifica TaxID=1267768 RepID=A0A1U7DKU3_9RHOB|nr:NADH-quinone oxidoreductase subunit E [Brevirhabdus pacifica]APX90610.1 NADH-quinone oxidoreductase subunit E [Brevirhabdus pacifica]OWU78396.1 hypothetical protein ATO5_05940 [Loktanella sp. 22II-4b]PJJ85251.1 NADH dehydrogenase subunit E [Brevirhabdus pacifica]